MRIRGDRLGTNALSMSTESRNNIHRYAQATNIFHGYALDYRIRSREEKNDLFVSGFNDLFSRKRIREKFAVKLWRVNERTTAAEEVTDL
jgi:hypothetical protein